MTIPVEQIWLKHLKYGEEYKHVTMCFNQICSTGIVIDLDPKYQQRSTEILFDYFMQTVSGSIDLACFR